MAKDYISLDPSTQPPHLLFLKSLGLAATCSALGAAVSSPFWLVKTRLQAQSSAPQLKSVGFQHKYTGIVDAFKSIYNTEGVRGLFRNVEANIIRLMVSGSVQLACYDTSKQVFLRSGYFEEGNSALHFSSSLITSVAVVAAWQPFDTAACRYGFSNSSGIFAHSVHRRLMNQERNAKGKGQVYSGFVDCFMKTYQTEGTAGLYKGGVAQYMRIAPYTCLTFVIFEKVCSLLFLLFASLHESKPNL
jgi:solute carrier family 25 protein 34/35